VAVGNNNVTATLKLRGQQAFGAGMRGAATSTKRLGSAMHATSRLGIGLGKGMARASLGIAGVGIAAGVAGVAIAAKFVTAAEDSARVGRDTAATLKSTGNAARTTAKHVGDLATAISNKTGMDDEAIQSGANMLLTFTNIRNEVGKGNNVFDQATQTVADLAAKMGTDPSKAAIQLGKALNDPVKGITALTKVGVTFDAQQKKQIGSMVKAGKMADAQKVILKELNKEFGGQAAAQSGSIGLLKTQMGNLEEQIGGYLLPYVTKAAQWLGTKGFKKISGGLDRGAKMFGRGMHWLGDAFKRAKPYAQSFLRFISPLVHIFARNDAEGATKGFNSLSDSLKRNSAWLKAFGVQLRDGIVKYGPTIAKYLGIFASLNLRGLLTGVGLAIDGIRYLGLGFVAVDKVILSALGHILAGATKAFGWMPGIGPKLKRANKSFANFAKSANADLDKIKDTLTVRVNTVPVAVEAVKVAAEKDYSRTAGAARIRADLQSKSSTAGDTVLKVGQREMARVNSIGVKKNSAWR
jgi:hypothetical protein